MATRIDEFSLEVSRILEDYAEDVQAAVAYAVEQTGKQALKLVKAKSPVRQGKGGGRYKKGWRMKKERGGVFKTQSKVTIYNATDGPLVHLLELGHETANGGQAEGIPHVQPAREEAERLLSELTAKAIEEASNR